MVTGIWLHCRQWAQVLSPMFSMRSHEHLWLPSRFLPLVPAAITYPMAWFYMSPAKWFWYLW